MAEKQEKVHLVTCKIKDEFYLLGIFKNINNYKKNQNKEFKDISIFPVLLEKQCLVKLTCGKKNKQTMLDNTTENSLSNSSEKLNFRKTCELMLESIGLYPKT